jgi:hypothetical protein
MSSLSYKVTAQTLPVLDINRKSVCCGLAENFRDCETQARKSQSFKDFQAHPLRAHPLNLSIVARMSRRAGDLAAFDRTETRQRCPFSLVRCRTDATILSETTRNQCRGNSFWGDMDRRALAADRSPDKGR